MKILVYGSKIKINNQPIETCIRIQSGFGLFVSETGYRVVRCIDRITTNQILN